MTPEQLEHVTRIAEKYNYGNNGWNKEHADKVAQLTQRILQQFTKLKLVDEKEADLLLAKAIALPHDIGRNPGAVEHRKYKDEHNISSFLTLKEELKGSLLNEDEAIVIQYCALFHTGDKWKHTVVPRKAELTKRLAGILRIADALDYELDQRVRDVTLTVQKNEVVCKVIASSATVEEIRRAYKKSNLFVQVFGREIKFK